MNAPSFGERRYRTRLKYFSGWAELTALVDILFLPLLFFDRQFTILHLNVVFLT